MKSGCHPLTLTLSPRGRGDQNPQTMRRALWLVLVLLVAQAQSVLGQEAPAAEPGTSVAVPAEGGEPGPAEGGAAASETSPQAPAPEPAIVPGEAFVNANAAYEAGRFSEAIELYRRLQDSGVESGHLYYNLGNAYLRNGELGQAVASFRRSLIFQPRDQDVRANLEFARKSARDAIAPPEPGAVARTLFFWHYSLSRSELGTLVVVLNLLLWGVLILRIYRRASETLRWIFFGLLLLLLTTGTSLALRHLRPQQVAVIVPQEVDVRSGTSANALVLFKLHAGTEVRVVDRREQALRIALPEKGRGGWIEAEHAEVVIE